MTRARPRLAGAPVHTDPRGIQCTVPLTAGQSNRGDPLTPPIAVWNDAGRRVTVSEHVCPSCGAPAAPAAVTCDRCQTPLRSCAACGTPLAPAARFCTRCGAPADGPAAPLSRRLSDTARSLTALLRRSPPEPAPPAVAALLVIGPRGDERAMPLDPARELLIGREPPAGLVLPDPRVSRRHARITVRNGVVELADLGSRNGTYVNGTPVRGRRPLEPGDEVAIGPYRLIARPFADGQTVRLHSRQSRGGRVGLGLALATVLATAVTAATVTAVAVVGGRGGVVTAPTGTAAPSEEQQATAAVQRVRPAVVRIATRGGVGTGVVVEEGLVMTNAHVVRGDASPSITLADGRTVPGRVLGRDEEVDLALVQIEVTGIPPIVWGDSDALRPGERLLAIGYPLGASVFTSGEASVTSGIFSAHRELRGRSYVQTDTPLNPGNSGGPLINLKGEVIGINTLVVGRTPELQAQGLNLAIPANVARPLVATLRDGR